MPDTNPLERLSGVVFAASAAVLAVVAVWNTVTTVRGEPSATTSTAPTYVERWQSIADEGRPLQQPNTPVRVIEFTDFQCPFCRRFDSTFKVVQGKFPGKISRVIVHLPLELHAYALGAVQAAECAAEQGRWAQMHDALFERQNEFGKTPWVGYASDAGVTDTTTFRECVESNTVKPKINRGLAVADSLSISATPTLIVNGWLFKAGVSQRMLTETIVALLDGKDPPNTKR